MTTTLDTTNVHNLANDPSHLQKQVENHKLQINALLAQLDAHKQMFNETLGTSLQLRTNIIMLEKHTKELTDKLNAANETIRTLKDQLATKEIGAIIDATDQVS